MPSVFLSHSSEDKERYVRIVANQLQSHFDEHSIHYDEYTFEAGMKSIDEILDGLSETDLFVVFLSRAALRSEWVKKELINSKKMLKEERIRKIYPLVIESDLEWKDELIPNWLKEYTLKYIPKPTKATQLIRKRLIEITWEINPKMKMRKNVFVGRNVQIEEFENRKYDYEKSTVLAYIAAGIQKVGRRKFLRHCFSKTNMIDEQYQTADIELGMYEGIEDVIIKVSNFGFSDNVDLTNFMKISIEQKCIILAKLIDDVSRNKEFIMINDEGCIVTHEGKVCDWFIRTLDLMKETNRTVMGIAAKFKIGLPIKNQKIFVINIPPLNRMECGGLMQKYLEIDNMYMENEDFKNYVNMMNGFPEQVRFTCSLIEKYGPKRTYDYSFEIQNYESEIIAQLMRAVEKSEENINLLVLLADIDMVSYQALQSIIGNDDFVKEKINMFYINGIIEFVGISREYIKINSAIKGHVTRAEYKLSYEYNQKLQNYVSNFLNQFQYEDLDMPDFFLKMKESLLHEGKIDNKYMIPSQYLKTMVELYEQQKDYPKVVEYADIVLQSTEYIEEKLVFEIRFFLCMALAKQRDRRMLSEVQHITGADHNFLLGFYYRMVGNYDKAIEHLEISLIERKKFAKAKREKVQVLINLERFEDALTVAKENYDNDKRNPYHIHAYFLCLIKNDEIDLKEKNDILKELLDNLEKTTTDFGQELFIRCSALKKAYMDNDEDGAFALINSAIKKSNSPIYSLQDKFDICERTRKYDEMNDVIQKVEKLRMRDTFGKERAMYRMKVLYAAYIKDKQSVDKLITEIREKGVRINTDILKKKAENIIYK